MISRTLMGGKQICYNVNMEEKDMNYCTMYLVRHGETEWNARHIVQGHSNSSLNETGILQVKETAEKLKSVNFDFIFSSDSVRAERTAEILKLDREILTETSELLRERNFGRFEGKHADILKNELKDNLQKLKELTADESWTYRLDDGIETDEELVSRFMIKLREIAVAYPNKTVLVVSHGGPIRMFLAKTGYADKESLYGGTFKNAGYVKVLSDGVDFFVKEVLGLKNSPGAE
jgi:broad specificity phosphatase PhoE